MTPRKKWPHVADWARMDAISKAREIRRVAGEIHDTSMDVVTVRKAGRIMEMTREIEAKLLEVGSERKDE